jgi:hypothetical protein
MQTSTVGGGESDDERRREKDGRCEGTNKTD